MGKIDKIEENRYLFLIQPENQYREEVVCILPQPFFFSEIGEKLSPDVWNSLTYGNDRM